MNTSLKTLTHFNLLTSNHLLACGHKREETYLLGEIRAYVRNGLDEVQPMDRVAHVVLLLLVPIPVFLQAFHFLVGKIGYSPMLLF